MGSNPEFEPRLFITPEALIEDYGGSREAFDALASRIVTTGEDRGYIEKIDAGVEVTSTINIISAAAENDNDYSLLDEIKVLIELSDLHGANEDCIFGIEVVRRAEGDDPVIWRPQ